MVKDGATGARRRAGMRAHYSATTQQVEREREREREREFSRKADVITSWAKGSRRIFFRTS
jgi:hypothetical protein